jgi:hypothetical protein
MSFGISLTNMIRMGSVAPGNFPGPGACEISMKRQRENW